MTTNSPLPPDLTQLDATALSDAIHQRQVSCRDVMASVLERIAQLNPRHNAIIALQPAETLLALADRADGELAAGQSRGWLHGLPFAAKDTGDAEGFVTSQGSPLLAENMAPRDCLPVGRIRNAGAIVVGKTNVPEFALGSQTYNTLHGATRNAFDSALCAGGSSGGAAVALALRLLPVADGSDMMGSLRNPAAYNGVFGFRPTTGCIPQDPLPEPFVHRLASAGPMARSLRDLRRLFVTMAGADRRDPLSRDPAPDPAPGAKGPVRIGWLGDWDGALAMEEGVLATCETALARGDLRPMLPAIGAPAFWEAWQALRSWAISTRLGPLADDPAKAALMKPELIWEIETGRRLDRAQIDRAIDLRAQCFTALLALFDKADVLAAPSAQCFAFDVNRPWPDMIAGRRMDTYHRWMEVTVAASLAACPVMNLPAGFDDRGRAMGVQLIGPPGGDLALFRQAAALIGESATHDG